MNPASPSAHPLALTDSKISVRRDMCRWLVDWLTRNARDPARIGERVILLHFLLHRFDDDRDTDPKQKELADRLNVSESRISIALKAILDDIEAKEKS